jgi:YjjG family noncanonical pyrimidine nucleotidase
LSKYHWILFDADGTLFDYDRAEATALKETFRQFGHPFEPGYVDAYRQINSRIWRAFEQGRITQQRLRTRRFEQLFDIVGADLDPVPFSATYLELLATQTELLDGAEEVVRVLYGRVDLALITNGLLDVQRPRLARSALQGYFGAVIISEEVGSAKPHPEIFETTFARMGHPPKEAVLMVGDSLSSDIRGGLAYGLDSCWYNPAGQPHPADLAITYEIGRLDELLEIVGIHED